MARSFNNIFILIFMSFLDLGPRCSACAHFEYETRGGNCCPKCEQGKWLYKDCTEMTDTVCVPCMGKTFLDVYNNQTECFTCMICDPGLGLRVKTACTQMSDAVCEPLQGFYCTHESRDSCIHAKKHTKCRPGEYIQHMGTSDRDAVCEKCAGGTFSNGSLQNCEPHTKCEDEGLVEKKPGTADSDTECGESSVGLILVIVIPIIALLALAAAAVLIYIKKKGKLQWPLRDTGRLFSSNVPLQETQTGADSLLPRSSVLPADSSCNPDSNTSRGPEETDEEMNNPLGKSENT